MGELYLRPSGTVKECRFVIFSDNLHMSLSFARAINPVTKTNWEEVGVEPDINVSQDAVEGHNPAGVADKHLKNK
jgi:hypothetical protein